MSTVDRTQTSNASGLNVPPVIQELEARNKVQSFIENSKILSEDILNEREVAAVPHVIHHYHSGWWSPHSWNLFNINMSSNSHSSPKTSDKKKKKNDEALILIGVVSLVATVFALFATGSSWSQYSDAKRALKETREFNNELSHHFKVLDPQDEGRNCTLLFKARAIAPIKEALCDRIRKSALASLVLRTSTLVGAATTSIGVFARDVNVGALIPLKALENSIPVTEDIGQKLVLGGMVVGGIALTGLLLKAVFSGSRKDAQDAKQIQEIINRTDPVVENLTVEGINAEVTLKKLSIEKTQLDIDAKKLELEKAKTDLNAQKAKMEKTIEATKKANEKALAAQRLADAQSALEKAKAEFEMAQA